MGLEKNKNKSVFLFFFPIDETERVLSGAAGNSLANFLPGFAVKVVVQTLGIVAGVVTLAVVKGAVAVCTAGPGVHGQGAVAAVPVTRQRVALLVTHTVVCFAMAVCQRAQRRLGLQGEHGLFAPLPHPALLTLAVEVREGDLFRAQAVVAAGFERASLVAAMLTLGAAVSLQAGASGSPGSDGAAPAVVAGQLPARHASVTVGPRITLKVNTIWPMTFHYLNNKATRHELKIIVGVNSLPMSTHKLTSADVS